MDPTAVNLRANVDPAHGALRETIRNRDVGNGLVVGTSERSGQGA